MMVKVREDMTGWKMWEHGVPDSRLIIVKQAEDYIEPKTGQHVARWLCECSCEEHNQIIVAGRDVRSGHTLSCGCYKKEQTSFRSQKFNKYDLSGAYGIGWASNTNREFYFDLEDYDKIRNFCWYENYLSPNYCVLIAYNKQTKNSILMHRLLVDYEICDHIDRNPFNNQKNNLRAVTQKENCYNRSISQKNTSGIIGVSWKKDKQKWKAYLTIDTKQKHLGYFVDKTDAIVARLRGEMKYFGIEFAPQRHLFKEYGIMPHKEDDTK